MKGIKKVVLILENSPSPIGGIERHCYNIRQLFNNREDIEVEILSKDVIAYRKIKKINKIIFSFKELKNKIISSGANTIHIHGFASLVVFQAIIASILAKKRIIYTPHFHPFHTLEKPLMGKIFFSLLLKPFLRKIDTIVSINNEDFTFFKRYHNKVITIPNWLNDTLTISEIIKQRSNKNKKMILFVGRADNNKGIDYISKLSSELYQVHCVTNGDIKDGFFHHQFISEEDLSELYFRAELVVIPSRYEAFSYVALEALCHGTKILVSDRVRILDHLDNDNLMVHKFIYGDYNGFLKQVNIIMHESANLEIDHDLNKIMDTFNKDRIKKVLKSIYT